MSDISADQLAQRIQECRLMETAELSQILADARKPGQDFADYDAFVDLLLRHEHLTNWQVQRVAEGHIKGYFYGNWRLLYLIGAGTFARVYRAVHVKTGDVKAVKVLRSRFSTDEAMREQFLREAKMVMRLRHPNIVPIHEVEAEKDRLYMVMDFVEGQNLRDYVRAHVKLSPVRCLKIISDLAAGLKCAADMGMGHRDMKLSNVLLSSKGQAKLVDFGLATLDGEKDATGGPRSVDYAGLEKCTNAPKDDPRSDLFFLGCMLYHMATGKAPLLETANRVKRMDASRFREAKPIIAQDPNLPARLVSVVNRLMELDPDKRMQTAREVYKEVNLAHQALLDGDTARASELADGTYVAPVVELPEGEGKTLLLIESNMKLQNLLRDRLKSIGYRVLITADPDRGLDRFDGWESHEEPPVDCVLFGTVGLGREALKAFLKHSRGEHTKVLPSILIVTKEIMGVCKKEWFDDLRVPIKSPVSFTRLKKSLRKLLDIKVEEPS